MNFALKPQYLRSAKSECAGILTESFSNHTGQLSVRHYSNVRIKWLGQLNDPDPSPQLIADDCDYCSEIITIASRPSVKLPGKSLYAGFIRKSWGHFLMNSTARLWPLFTEKREDYDHIVFYNEDNSTSFPDGNFRDFLRLAGLLPKCVVLPEGETEFEYLDVPDLSIKLESHWSEEFFLPFDYVRRTALAESNYIPHSKGIILARSVWNAKNKMQINVEAIEDYFVTNGYTRIIPEHQSLTQLISAMEGAEEIVSFSGSTAHNFLFSKGKRLVTLERCAANNMYQTAISLNPDFRHIPVDCYWQPMPVLSTDNLTIYGFTPELRNFAVDHDFPVIFDVCTSEQAPIKEFRQFLKIYSRHYGYGCPLHPYESAQFPAIAEACIESRSRYARYLDLRIPVLWHDFLSPRVWVRFLRDMIHHRVMWS